MYNKIYHSMSVILLDIHTIKDDAKAQRDDGIWDVIDGVQRLSTIFEFVGILKDEKEHLCIPSKLTSTKYLPSLEGKYWDNKDDPDNSFTGPQRIDFKRAKLDIKIINLAFWLRK